MSHCGKRRKPLLFTFLLLGMCHFLAKLNMKCIHHKCMLFAVVVGCSSIVCSASVAKSPSSDWLAQCTDVL